MLMSFCVPEAMLFYSSEAYDADKKFSMYRVCVCCACVSVCIMCVCVCIASVCVYRVCVYVGLSCL